MRTKPIEPPSASVAAAAPERAPIAFFCSQSCPGDIILKAQDWADARGPESAPVIGGFHTSIERDVLRILLRGDAPVTLVLARAVQDYRMSPAIKVAVATGQAQIISPFLPPPRPAPPPPLPKPAIATSSPCANLSSLLMLRREERPRRWRAKLCHLVEPFMPFHLLVMRISLILVRSHLTNPFKDRRTIIWCLSGTRRIRRSKGAMNV